MVREAKAEDMKKIAELHCRCFPANFSTKLGEKKKRYLLCRFYEEYRLTVPELFLVSENEAGEMVGFCMGYYCDQNDYARRFLKKNFFRIAFRFSQLLLQGNKRAWNKLKGLFSRGDAGVMVDSSFDRIPAEKRGALLSIGVREEYRGKGFAQELIDEYQKILKRQKKEYCFLSVERENGRAISFYERNGFQTYKESARGLRVYAKALSCEALCGKSLRDRKSVV